MINKESDLLSVGKTYFENEEYEEAIKTLSELLKLNPNNEEALTILGASYYYNEEYKEALQPFLKAYELNPKEFDSWDLLGDSYYKNEEYDKAIEFLLKAIELNPYDNYDLRILRFCYEEKRQYKEARATFLKENKDWIEFYKEFANKLLDYKNNRPELIDKMKSIFTNIKIKIPKHLEKKDIDPFSILTITMRTEEIINEIKDKFEINSKYSGDYYPCRLGLFYPHLQNHIENLWNIFEAAINYADNKNSENREKFIKAFNLAKDIKGIKWDLTIGLHWIRPFNYMNLDISSKKFIIQIIPDYAKYLSDENKSMINGEEYLTICDKLIEVINNNNYEFKNLAELQLYAYYDYSIEYIAKYIEKNIDNVDNADKEEVNEMNIKENYNQSNKYNKKKFLQEVFITEKEYNKLVDLIKDKQNIILQGSAGVGKTYVAKRLAYSIIGEENKKQVKMIQFHQSYSYEDFIMGFRPSENEGFELKEGVFYRFCKEAEDDEENEYFLIIDEINRGNISKIFGELFMLIENDKRGEEAELLYKDELFSVPKNLYIIGLMNTADRSLAMLDYALRRRFAFYDMKPAFDSKQFKDYQNGLKNNKFDNLIKTVKDLNKEISEELGEGFCIGHSYFCNFQTVTDDKLSQIIEYELIPLLKEYWFDDKDKVNTWIKNLTDAIK